MTDMKITGCAPLPGQGLAARHGDLIVVSEDVGPGPDPLLGVLEEVAATAGDGGALVLAVARAVLANLDQVSGACAGITAGGEVAVLVHGSAVAIVAVDGGQEVQLTASASMLPVSRTFAGTTVTVQLALGIPGDLDARLRLDGGIVSAGGLAVTASASQAKPGTAMPGTSQPAGQVETAVPSKAADTVRRRPPGPKPVGAQTGIPTGVPAGGETAEDKPQVTVSLATVRKQSAAVAAEQETPPASPGRAPKLHEPNPAADFEWISLALEPDEPDEPGEPGEPGEAHDHDHAAEPDVPPLAPEGAEPVMVEGVLCARNHFNDPDVAYCRQCGLSMVQQTRRTQLGQRPPLGVLLLDDGTAFTLDRDYVLGREPVLDGDVATGLARPLRITDPNGTVGRVHLRVSLVGWQVTVKDLGSVNGSVVYLAAGGEDKLSPHESVVIAPGTRIGIGRRTLQYLSYRAG
jgi:hypothetical protein